MSYVEIYNFKVTGQPTSQVLRASHTYRHWKGNSVCSSQCLSFVEVFSFSINGVLQIIHYLEILVDQGTSWKTSLEILSEIGTWILYDLPCYNVGSDAQAIGTNKKKKASIIFKVLCSILWKFCYATLFHPCTCLYTYLL